MPDMSAMANLHHGVQGVPMGVQMMPIEMTFPVDPALTSQNADGEADADAEGDADGDADAEEDADGDNDGENNGDADGEESNRPQLTHSTSNACGSTNTAPTSKTRTSSRTQGKSNAGTPSTGGTRPRGRPPKSATQNSNANSTQQQQQVQTQNVNVNVNQNPGAFNQQQQFPQGDFGGGNQNQWSNAAFPNQQPPGQDSAYQRLPVNNRRLRNKRERPSDFLEIGTGDAVAKMPRYWE